MKKFASIILALALLCALFAGCQQKEPVVEVAEFDPQEPVTVCFDLDGSYDERHFTVDESSGQTQFTGDNARKSAVEQLLKEIKESGGPENVTYEFIEDRGEDREGALTRLRTEIMGGGGPDVFVISQQGFGNDLFKFVEKKMEEKIFLPLDGYMEQAQFMDPVGMNQAVLSGGRNSKGQQMVIPLRYNFPATMLPAEETKLDLSQAHSLADMLDGSDPALTEVLASWWNPDPEWGGFNWGVSEVLGKRADYAKEKLLLSQEEFRETVKQLCQFAQGAEEGSGLSMTWIWKFRPLDKSISWRKDPVAIVPLYNVQGGVTAKIEKFAAVNRNAQNPAGAFWVVDYMLGEEQFQDADIHRYMNSYSLPIYDGLMKESAMLPYLKDNGERDPDNFIYYDDQDWQAVDAARGQITSAEFPTELDKEIDSLIQNVVSAPQDQRDKLIDECYRKLEMLIGEA